jgi:hypothetical protein
MSTRRDREFVVRLAVGDARGACSSVWRFWRGRNTDDLYIAPRNIAGCLKISLHDSGWFGLAVTKQFYEKLRDAGDIPETITSRTILNWQRGITPEHGCTEVSNMLFPSEFLAAQFIGVEHNTCLISPPHRGKAIIIFCFICRPDAQLALAPDQKEVGRCTLSTGDKFVIISGIFDDFDATSFWHQYQARLQETERISILPKLPYSDPKQLGGALCLPIREDHVLRLVVIGPEFVQKRFREGDIIDFP